MQLSIIIPMYNAENYILNLLDSIYKQDNTSVEFEVVIVDDLSIDQSVRYVEQYIRTNLIENIKLIKSTQNGGTAIARNVGIKNSKGDWVQFLDSDDYLAKDYFEKISSPLVEAYDCYIYGTSSKYADKVITHTPSGQIDQRMIGYKNSVCNKIFKRNIISLFNPDYKFEDVIWLVETINQSGVSCQTIPNLYYHINRTNQNSKMANIDQDEWYKMAVAVIAKSKQSNKFARSFVLETFVGTIFAKSFKLNYRVLVGLKALLYNYKYLPYVVRHGIRYSDNMECIQNK